MRVLLLVTELMTALVDWINISLVMEDNGMLLQLLLEMLSLAADMRIQLAAVECLLAVTGRRVIFLVLYSQFVLVLSDRFSVLYKSVMFFSVVNCANAKFKK